MGWVNTWIQIFVGVASLTGSFVAGGRWLLAMLDKRLDAKFDEKFDQQMSAGALGARFNTIDQRFDAMDRRFDAIDQRLDAMDRRFDAVDRRLDGVDHRLETLATVTDVRLKALEDDMHLVKERLLVGSTAA